MVTSWENQGAERLLGIQMVAGFRPDYYRWERIIVSSRDTAPAAPVSGEGTVKGPKEDWNDHQTA
jgi:hypothetical protein